MKTESMKGIAHKGETALPKYEQDRLTLTPEIGKFIEDNYPINNNQANLDLLRKMVADKYNVSIGTASNWVTWQTT